MSNATTTPITRQTIALALHTARQLAAADKRWMVALAKAEEELGASIWIWYADVATLKIASRTTANRYHVVTATGCTCPAHARSVACWHRAARRVLERAAQHA